jgi:hypothetical protein
MGRKTKPRATTHVARHTQPYRVNLPGFIKDEIGLGSAIRRMTHAMGIKSCGGCESRAVTLNRWVVFGRKS